MQLTYDSYLGCGQPHATPTAAVSEEEAAIAVRRPPEAAASTSRVPEAVDYSGLVCSCPQELVSRQNKRGWRAMLAAGAVALLVLALVIAGAVLLSGRPTDTQEAAAALGSLGKSVALQQVITGELSPSGANVSWVSELGGAQGDSRPSIDLDDIVDERFNPFGAESFNCNWVSDDEFLYKDSFGNVMLYDLSTKTKRQLLSNEELANQPSILMELSADRKYMLVSSNHSKLFRHTFLAHYDIYDLETRVSTPLINGDGFSDNRVLQLVVWAPTGNALAYVYHNNIYYRPSAFSRREVKLTTTGTFGSIYHGIPDWVYEEEVLSSNTAMWFSPDGKKLAYATFNDTLTRVMTIPYYGFPNNLDYQYTRAVNIRYPKPGTPNPTVTLTVVLLDQELRSLEVPPPDELIKMEPILAAVTWANENEVSAVWLNRVQNKAIVAVCNSESLACQNILNYDEPNGWVDLFTPPKFSERGDKMVLIYPQDQGGSAGAFRHVTIIDRSQKELLPVPLTAGKYVVTEISSWDTRSGKIYYLATEENDPSMQHLYSISDKPSQKPREPKCLSCNTKTEGGGKLCQYNKATFSPKSSYYMLNCVGPDVPEASIFDKDQRKILIWERNEEIRELLQGRALPRKKILEVDVPGGFKAQVQLLLPPNMEPHKKYPMLINVYGGPDSFQVTQRFSVDWSTYLTVNRSVIYASIDGRGSGLKGNKMLFAGYRRLGSVEIDDQINVTRYLQENFEFIDANRTGIWGWSYGGYSTGMALAKDQRGVFKCGISVAPVTDWAYYDTVYTERYMGLPTVSDNLKGYVESELTARVDNLRNKMFFLVHGTLDDNVHYQQSMILSKALEHKDILFRQQSYTDEEHGLTGVRPHLYHSLESFLEECFNLK